MKNDNHILQKGLVLAEVIVVAVIVAILATVAVPLYSGYVTTQRTQLLKSIAEMTAASASIYYRRSNAVPACGSTADCVSKLGIFIANQSQFDVQIAGTTVTVKDNVHTTLPPQTASF